MEYSTQQRERERLALMHCLHKVVFYLPLFYVHSTLLHSTTQTIYTCSLAVCAWWSCVDFPLCVCDCAQRTSHHHVKECFRFCVKSTGKHSTLYASSCSALCSVHYTIWSVDFRFNHHSNNANEFPIYRFKTNVEILIWSTAEAVNMRNENLFSRVKRKKKKKNGAFAHTHTHTLYYFISFENHLFAWAICPFCRC